MTVFELLGTIVIDSSQANRELDKTKKMALELNDTLEESGRRADGLGEKLGDKNKLAAAIQKFNKMLGKLALKVGGYVKDFAISGISMAGTLEKQIHAVETLFGDAAASVLLNAHNAARTAGISANEYLRIANGLASALKGSVETEAEAAEIADRTITDMADNASAMGTEMGLIEKAYQGFAEQNYTMLDSLRLGYGGTREEMQRLLADASRLAGREFDISKPSDVFEAIHVVQEGKGIAGMAASHAGTTFMGSMNAAKAAWDNLVSGALLIVIPQLTKLFNEMAAWAEANPEKVQQFADALTAIAAISFEGMLEAFRWLTENGQTLAVALAAIGGKMLIGAIAAHPFAAAILAAVAGLSKLKEAAKGSADGSNYDHFLGKYTEEELKILQEYVDAVKAANEAAWEANEVETENPEDPRLPALYARLKEAEEAKKAATEKANAIEDLIGNYNAWRNGQPENVGDNVYLDVPFLSDKNAEEDMQAQIDGYELEGMATISADPESIGLLQTYLNSQSLFVNVLMKYIDPGVPSSSGVTDEPPSDEGTSKVAGFATGLDRVYEDERIVRVHKDEAILNAAAATAWRSGQTVGGTGKLEALMSQMNGLLQRMAENAGMGQKIVLDSGVLVGQLAPAMNARLGTISERNRRGNS